MLQINDLTYRIGPRVLLDQASAVINEGHRVGLVGRNGTGKTTLLRLITGALQADGGGIELPPRAQIGITTQEAPNGEESLIETVLAADRELASLNAEALTATDPGRIAAIHTRLADKHAHTARARAARILAGLGFDAVTQERPCRSFSGGWRMRVALAGLLFTQPDLLLLDEPTNHLDLEATIWLESFLKSYRATILIVSHERDFLNNVVDHILHLDRGKVTLYPGGYDAFGRQRAERAAAARQQQSRSDRRHDDPSPRDGFTWTQRRAVSPQEAEADRDQHDRERRRVREPQRVQRQRPGGDARGRRDGEEKVVRFGFDVNLVPRRHHGAGGDAGDRRVVVEDEVE